MEITPEIESIVKRYEAKYHGKVEWEVILDNVARFAEDRDYLLTYNRDEWYGFLAYLSQIESTIGLFGYTSKGTFHRIFTMFGRAYLEELAIIISPEGKSIGLEWASPETARFFHTGDGKANDIDLVDRDGNTYDVKNDHVYFEKSHGADYLLKFRSFDGYVELHQQPTDPSKGSFKGIFATCQTLAQIANIYNLDPLLFDKSSSEEDIERYLGLID